MKTLIIDNGTKHLQALKNLLSKNVLTIIKSSEDLPTPSDFNLIILSGSSKFAVKENPEKFVEEIKLVKNSNIPIIGICAGCEIVAYTYNSQLESFKPKEKGIKEIKIVNSNYFKVNKPIKVYEAHHWAIKKLGKDLTGIAKSKHGWEIIKVKDRNVYGLQFHPEMLTDMLLGDEIFRKITKLITNGN